MYDPRFTWWEKQILTDEGCSVIPHNEVSTYSFPNSDIDYKSLCTLAEFNLSVFPQTEDDQETKWKMTNCCLCACW